jgi:hypothetical protein
MGALNANYDPTRPAVRSQSLSLLLLLELLLQLLLVFLVPLLDQLSSFVFFLVAKIEDTRADQPEENGERDGHQDEEEHGHAEHKQDFAKWFFFSPIGRTVRSHGDRGEALEFAGMDGDCLHDDWVTEVIPNSHHEPWGGRRGCGCVEIIVENEVKSAKVNSFVLILEAILAIGSGVGGLGRCQERGGGSKTWYMLKRDSARYPRLRI